MKINQNQNSNINNKKPIDCVDFNIDAKGAVTFLDVLGWKGIWRDKKSDAEENAIAKLTRLIYKIKEQSKEIAFGYGPSDFNRGKNYEVELLSISDTIVFFTEGLPEKTISIHCDLCSWTLNEALKMGLPLRGAISYGLYEHDDRIMIGPAVDEAAGWHESTNWIGVVLAPSAFFELKGKKPVKAEQYTKIPYKSGIKGPNWCVDWEYKGEDGAKNEIYSVFSKRGPLMQDVAPKYLNTMEFLNRERNV